MSRSALGMLAVVAAAFAGSVVGLAQSSKPASEASASQAVSNHAKAAPFTQLRWNDLAPEVLVQGNWYELLAIDDLTAGQMVSFCRKTWGEGGWKRKLSEELVEVMTRMGKTPGATVLLKLRSSTSGKEMELAAAMTAENREATRQAALLTQSGRDVEPLRQLSAEDVALDLSELAKAMREQFAYAKRGVDIEKATAEIQAKFASGGTTRGLVIEIQKMLARFGDPSTKVRRLQAYLPNGFLPCDTVMWGDRVVAVRADTQFLDEKRPFITRIDGKPVEQWLEAAGKLAADGSPTMKRHRTMELLPMVSLLRGEMQSADGAQVELELVGDGVKQLASRFDKSEARVTRPTRPARESREFEGKIGYLRPASINDDQAVAVEVDGFMAKFRETNGLIVDLRGNRGTARDWVRALFPYFMDEGELPVVANVAAYRLRAGDKADDADGFLGNRSLYPANWKGWTEAERVAIAKAAESFKPEWTLPAGEFSAWHYFVLRRDLNPKACRYAKPVVVLMDTECSAATDVMLAALKGRKDVKLVGQPSAGGSGRVATVALPRSRVEVLLTTMVSYRADGKLFDMNGVEPDVVHAPLLEDVQGKGDSVLSAAVRMLNGK